MAVDNKRKGSNRMTLTQEHRDRLKGKGLLSKIVVDSLVKASGEDPQIEGEKRVK